MAKHQFLPAKVRRPRDDLRQAVDQIEKVMGCYVVGSWRRQKETVGDLDVIVPHFLDFGEMGEQFTTFFDYEPVRAGAVKSEGIAKYQGEPLLINLWRVPEVNNYGAMFLYATGPTDLNIMMRSKAQGKGFKLSQYGLFDASGAQLDIGYEEWPANVGNLWLHLEADIFQLLDLQFLSPVERERWRDKLLAKPTKKKTVSVYSSNGVDTYFVTIEDGKAVECECQGFTYRKKCRHLAEAEAIAKGTG